MGAAGFHLSWLVTTVLYHSPFYHPFMAIVPPKYGFNNFEKVTNLCLCWSRQYGQKNKEKVRILLLSTLKEIILRQKIQKQFYVIFLFLFFMKQNDLGLCKRDKCRKKLNPPSPHRFHSKLCWRWRIFSNMVWTSHVRHKMNSTEPNFFIIWFICNSNVHLYTFCYVISPKISYIKVILTSRTLGHLREINAAFENIYC